MSKNYPIIFTGLHKNLAKALWKMKFLKELMKNEPEMFLRIKRLKINKDNE